MAGRLDGKVAIVTGGAQGQGEAEARRFVAEGASVVIGDISDEQGAAVAASLGDAARFVHLDVTDASQWAAAVKVAEDEFGPVSVLVNNAGILVFAPLQQLTEADLRKSLDVNLMGTFHGMQAVYKSMKAAGGGSIVNISASSSVLAIPGRPAYQASKGAINALTRQMAVDYGKDDIRVNTIVVGFVFTGTPVMTAILENPKLRAAFEANILVPRLGEPADIAAGVVYLASDESKYVTGTQLTIDGGTLCRQALPELDFDELKGSE